MDPTTTFCPNGHCHARGQIGKGNIGIHSRKEQRFICHECHKTLSATKGTAFYGAVPLSRETGFSPWEPLDPLLGNAAVGAQGVVISLTCSFHGASFLPG